MSYRNDINLDLYKTREVILSMLDEYGLGKPVTHGNPELPTRYYFLCPFHKEKTPSFMVDRSPRIVMRGPNRDHPRWEKRPTWGFKCFGCGKAGDVFRFIELKQGVPFPVALWILRKKFYTTIEKAYSDPFIPNQFLIPFP